MIFVKDEHVMYEGKGINLLAELTLVIHGLYKDNNIPKEVLMSCVDTGCMDDEEIRKEVREELKKPENMVKMMNVILETMGPDAIAKMVREADDRDGEK